MQNQLLFLRPPSSHQTTYFKRKIVYMALLDIVDTKQVFALEGKTYITEPTQ